MTRSPFAAATIATLAIAIGACSTLFAPPAGNEPRSAIALIGRDGGARGTVVIGRDRAGKSVLTIGAANLPAGLHGVHLHEKGLCEGPAFTSAGAHWNPTGRQHGRANPAGSHLGDLPNLAIGASGTGRANFSAGAVAQAMADGDGTALVVHAKSDDHRTDPSGNSGDRIACAVIAAPR